MVETHPYPPFVPRHAKYLLLGSFLAKKYENDPDFDWYYGAKRNQFWKILAKVYGRELSTRKSKQQLLTDLQMAITDIIYQCERKHGNSLDANLINIVYNTPAIEKILHTRTIERIFFTSRFVETRFLRMFKNFAADYPDVDLVTLPSPSPRYAQLSLAEKTARYKQLLPLN